MELLTFYSDTSLTLFMEDVLRPAGIEGVANWDSLTVQCEYLEDNLWEAAKDLGATSSLRAD